MPRDCLFLSTEAQLSQFCEFLHQENEKKNKAIESRFVQLPPLILPGFENSCLSHCLINIPCRKKNLISSRYKPCTEGSFNHSSPSTVLQEKKEKFQGPKETLISKKKHLTSLSICFSFYLPYCSYKKRIVEFMNVLCCYYLFACACMDLLFLCRGGGTGDKTLDLRKKKKGLDQNCTPCNLYNC